MATGYIGFTLTQAGEDIMARIIAGLEISFKRIAIGDGYDYDVENFKNRTELVNEVMSLNNLTMQVTAENEVLITGRFTKSDIEQSFWYREVGLYIVDPDDETKEILYAYGNRNDEAEYITPDISNYGVLKELNFYVSVGKSANVTIYISSDQVTTEVNFAQSDWTLSQTTGLYHLILGAVNKVIKVCKVDSGKKIDVPGVDIIEESNITTLRALTPFTGLAVTI
ncbi:MAG: hypothetical protein SPL76_01850 [Cyanobacteriota bacterium]|nr:hypothetical protein [Cyanobacteriota bacterium]